MAGQSQISVTTARLLQSLNLIVSLLIGVLVGVLYWLWIEGDIGGLSDDVVRRVKDDAFLFRAMWAGIVATFAMGVAWVILESVRPYRE